MHRRLAAFVFVALGLAAIQACGPQPDLATDLKVVSTLSGYADGGANADGHNRLVPSITFQLKNVGQLPISHVDLLVTYWPVGDAKDLDSKLVVGVGGTALEPGATSEPLTVQASLGYESELPRTEFFTNPIFKGFTVKMFAKKRGRLTPLGDFPVEARILPTGKNGNRP